MMRHLRRVECTKLVKKETVGENCQDLAAERKGEDHLEFPWPDCSFDLDL